MCNVIDYCRTMLYQDRSYTGITEIRVFNKATTVTSFTKLLVLILLGALRFVFSPQDLCIRYTSIVEREQLFSLNPYPIHRNNVFLLGISLFFFYLANCVKREKVYLHGCRIWLVMN